MKKIFFVLTAALFAYFVGTPVAGLSLAIFALHPQNRDYRNSEFAPTLANREVMERLANSFDNYEEENYDDMDGDKFGRKNRKTSGIFTMNINNANNALREFWLFFGLAPYSLVSQILTIPSVAVAAGVTAAQNLEVNPDGIIKDGTFTAIGGLAGLSASGTPNLIRQFLGWLHANPGQKLTGMSITSSAPANHGLSIQVGEITPFKSDAEWDAPIDIKSFRSPKDYDATITILRTDIALNRNRAIKMAIAPNSDILLKLYMNGQPAA